MTGQHTPGEGIVAVALFVFASFGWLMTCSLDPVQADTLCWIPSPARAEGYRVTVSGLDVVGTIEDRGDRLCLDVPAIERPYSFMVYALWPLGQVAAVLEDGRPGPLRVYRSIECRADLNDNGAVGAGDLGDMLGVLGKVCG